QARRWQLPCVGPPKNPVTKTGSILGRHVRIQIIRRESLAGERRRLGREWLGRPRVLSRHVTFRHGPLFDGPQRSARDAIEYPDESLFAYLRDCINCFSVVRNLQQFRSRGIVVVPDVVVDHLEVPQALAGPGVERKKCVGEKVRARSVDTVKIVLGARGRRINNAASLVEGEFTPDITSADNLPGVWRPGTVAEPSRMRNGVESPYQLAGSDVERPNIAGSRTVSLVGRRAENDEVLENASRCSRLHQPK